MKKIILFAVPSLIFICFVAGCNHNPTQFLSPTTQLETSTDTSAGTIRIIKDPLLLKAFNALPERFCLHYDRYTDSNNVTTIVTFADTCENRTYITYTNFVKGEFFSFERKYPNNKKLVLLFYYEGDTLSVRGSKIITPMDTLLLSKAMVNKIVTSNYKI